MAGTAAQPLRVLVVAPLLDGGDVGEVYSAFKWVEALSGVARVTVLASTREGARPLAEQLPLAEVVTWPEPPFLYRRLERLNAMGNLWLPVFGRHVAAWVRAAQAEGRRFDIAHQILPQAMRHATALRDLGIPYVLGPLGGGLETPEGFRAEVGKGSLMSRLRALDGLRQSYDPALRASYARASLLLGVAPYIGERLREIGFGNVPFRAVLERGHGPLPPLRERQSEPGRLAMVHVGRGIRTKGLRDAIRAMALLRDLPEVTLTSVGDGEDMAACRAEAATLGLGDRVTFLGRKPRAEVDAVYAAADVFCFPSFREPMGGVLFEAMEHGLPIITAARGGPDFIVDDASGIRLPVTTPEEFARSIADAARRLALDPALRLRLGQGARARVTAFGTWEEKALHTVEMYRDVLSRRQAAAA